MWRALNVYAEPRMALLFVLGFSSGLPILLVFSTLGIWLTEVGIDKSMVGAFALASTPYSFKFLWAPLVDQLRLPVLERLLGRRRAWMLASQVALFFAIGALAFSAPVGFRLELLGLSWSTAENVARAAALAITVAALSATQDIVLDAYRVEILDRSEQAAGSAVFVFGYRMGMLMAGAGALVLATRFEAGADLLGIHAMLDGLGLPVTPWAATYFAMAACMAPGIVATVLGRRPPVHAEQSRERGTGIGERFASVLRRAVVEPFAAFVRNRGGGLWVAVLVFVLMFKLSDALAAVLRNPFLIDVGFAKGQIAAIAQTYGMVASIVGALLGGWLVKAFGLKRGLWASLLLMIVSNLFFAIQARLGADAGFLVLTITVENLTGGFGTAAFVAYLSLLCDVRYTATQYALLTSLSSVGRTMVGASTGVFAEAWGWEAFFVMTAVAGAPAVLVLYVLSRMGRLGVEPPDGEQAGGQGVEAGGT